MSENFLDANLGEPDQIKNINENSAKQKKKIATLNDVVFLRFLKVHPICSAITITGIAQKGVSEIIKLIKSIMI